MMAKVTQLASLHCRQQGTNQPWLSPAEPARRSESLAELKSTAHGQFTELEYLADV